MPNALTLRLRTRRMRPALDRALAQGASPSDAPELAVRAAELRDERTRKGLARCLLNLIDAAEEPVVTWRAQGIDPPLRTSAVLDARDELVSLAGALARDEPSLRGVALAAQLVWDPRSPIYSPLADGDLAAWAKLALEA